MAKLRHKSIAVHILISPDKFKGSLSASQVCEALEKGIKKRRPKTVFTTLPLADGGEGTLEVIQQLHGGIWISIDTFDPLMRPIQADYLWLADQKTAYIEMARASGLALLTIKERNPLKTSTFGTGVLIADALKRGATQIILTIGGSATNDAGIGMAAAMGWTFLDGDGATLNPVGENMIRIASISAAEPVSCSFTVVTDVSNPLAGNDGAAHVFAAQKGATTTVIKQLDKGLNNLTSFFGSIASEPGAGAAGGLGAGARYFLNAKIVAGSSWIMDKVHFNRALLKADFIITGEGKIDSSTWGGKVVSEVVKRSDKVFKQTILVSGDFESSANFPLFLDENEVFTIASRSTDATDSIARAAEILEQIGEEIALKYLN
ncbi:glycerate kinase [Aquirufa antheringensis]